MEPIDGRGDQKVFSIEPAAAMLVAPAPAAALAPAAAPAPAVAPAPAAAPAPAVAFSVAVAPARRCAYRDVRLRDGGFASSSQGSDKAAAVNYYIGTPQDFLTLI